MTNPTYKTGEKVFEDKKTGHRIKVIYKHFGIQSSQRIIPATKIEAAYLPGNNEDIDQLIQRVGGNIEEYHAAKEQRPGIDQEIRTRGLGFSSSDTFQFQNNLYAAYDYERLTAGIIQKEGNQFFGSLENDTLKAIDDYLTQEASANALKAAEAAYARTGSRPQRKGWFGLG